MKLDPTKMKDWQVAEAAEQEMKPVSRLADEMGLKEDELLPVGRQLGKVDYMKVLSQLKDAPSTKFIDVTAITPTPLGEGKTTTAIGLIEGLGKKGKGAIKGDSLHSRKFCPVVFFILVIFSLSNTCFPQTGVVCPIDVCRKTAKPLEKVASREPLNKEILGDRRYILSSQYTDDKHLYHKRPYPAYYTQEQHYRQKGPMEAITFVCVVVSSTIIFARTTIKVNNYFHKFNSLLNDSNEQAVSSACATGRYDSAGCDATENPPIGCEVFSMLKGKIDERNQENRSLKRQNSLLESKICDLQGSIRDLIHELNRKRHEVRRLKNYTPPNNEDIAL